MHSQAHIPAALICLLQYEYSATVRPLWFPGSCQTLLASLSHQRSSSLHLPIDNIAIVAGLIFLWQGFNGLYCTPSAIHSVGGYFSTVSQKDEQTVQ